MRPPTCTVYLSPKGRRPEDGKKFDPASDTEFPAKTAIDFATDKTFLALNTHDYTCPEFAGGKRKAEEFVRADCLYLDFDHLTHEENWAEWNDKTGEIKKEILSAFPNLAFALYPSISKTGCHVLIPLAEAVTTPAQFTRITTTLVQLLPKADLAVKDAGRFSFATCMNDLAFLRELKIVQGNPLKVQEAEKVARRLEQEKKATVSKEARTLMSPSHRDVMEGITFEEGRRNNDCIKLACRLLNRYDEGMAKEMYDALTAPCTLDQDEKETVWKHAVNGMLGQGLIYKRPQPFNSIYEDIEMPTENKAYDRDITDPLLVQEKYIDYYGRYGSKLALGMIIKEYTDAREAGMAIPVEFIRSLASKCQQWGEEIIVPQVGESLGNLKPTGKTVGEVAKALATYISSLPQPLLFLSETGQWKQYSTQVSKWVDVPLSTVTQFVLDAIGEMRARITASGYTDRNLSLALNKLANSSKLVESVRGLLTISYKDVQARKAYTIATPSGLIDLHADTLKTVPTKPEDYVFETTKVSLPTVHRSPNKWEEIVKQVIPEEDKRDFFRMAIGSQMTGHLVRDGLFFWVGSGANGKSTLFDTISYVLGDYAGTLDPEILGTGLRKNEYDYGRASVMGKRFVIAQEAGPNMHLNPSQVKRLCSAHDTISASLKYRNAFEFQPTHTINFIANQLPSLGNTTDYGLMRRILGVFYFTQRFDGDKADPNLTHDLQTEWGSECLEWLCECAREYIRRGEKLPVLESNEQNIEEYGKEQDSFEEFLKECFTSSPDKGVTPPAVMYLYNAWCKSASGIFPNLNQVSLGKQMKAHGFASKIVRIDRHTLRVYPGLDFNKESVAWKIMASKDFRGEVPFNSIDLPYEPDCDF